MTDKDKSIRWFENIAYECDKLTSGNVAHLRAQIKGMAIRSAEYLKKQEPASKDIEQELEAFIKSGKAKKEENFGNFTTTHIDPLKIARHFAEWGSAHLTNKASKIEGEDLVDATNNYCLNIRKGYPRVKDETDVFICNAFKAGAQWQREQMMKGAMQCHIDYYDGPNLDFTQKQLDDALEKNGIKVGDKVKVIIVKE